MKKSILATNIWILFIGISEILFSQETAPVNSALNKKNSLQKEQALISNKIILFKTKAQSKGIDSTKINQVVNAYKTHLLKISQHTTVEKKEEEELLINLYNKKKSITSLEDSFKVTVIQLLSLDEFIKLFGDQFKYEIRSKTEFEYKKLTQNYKITAPQEQQIKTKVKEFVKEEIVLKKYYENQRGEERTEALSTFNEKKRQTYEQLFVDLGLKRKKKAQNSKLRKLVNTAIEAGVSNKNIHQLIQIVEERDVAYARYKRAKNYSDKNYAITFKDENYSMETIKRTFRKKLNKLITLDQFKEMFSTQLKPITERAVKQEMSKIQQLYSLNNSQKEKIHQFVKKELFFQTVTSEYYAYDKKLAKQKAQILAYGYREQFQTLVKKLKL